jgi:hypothetical protein
MTKSDNQQLIYESIALFTLSLMIFVYMYYSNPDNIIGRYYKMESPMLYNIFNLNMIIVKIILFFNLKYLAILFFQKYIHIY